jgi:L-amino acid N-acyltransferase YncA
VTSWRETYRGIIADRYLETRTPENRTEMWHLALDSMAWNCVFLVVEGEAGEIVGFAYGGPARDSEFGQSGELYAMYLLKNYQDMGNGKALFNVFLETMRSKEIGEFHAKVIQGNPSGGFFITMGGRSCGFVEATMAGLRGGRRLTEEVFEWVGNVS